MLVHHTNPQGPSEGGLATASELQPSQPHMSWQEGVQPSSEVPQTHPQPASSSQAPPSVSLGVLCGHGCMLVRHTNPQGPSEGGLATASKLQPQTQARRKRVAFQRQTGPVSLGVLCVAMPHAGSSSKFPGNEEAEGGRRAKAKGHQGTH